MEVHAFLIFFRRAWQVSEGQHLRPVRTDQLLKSGSLEYLHGSTRIKACDAERRAAAHHRLILWPSSSSPYQIFAERRCRRHNACLCLLKLGKQVIQLAPGPRLRLIRFWVKKEIRSDASNTTINLPRTAGAAILRRGINVTPSVTLNGPQFRQNLA